MFSGNIKFLTVLLSIIGGLFIISKLKYLILFLSWAIIFFCLGVVFIKANSKNENLQRKIDYYFMVFMNSKFAKFLIKLKEKLNKGIK